MPCAPPITTSSLPLNTNSHWSFYCLRRCFVVVVVVAVVVVVVVVVDVVVVLFSFVLFSQNVIIVGNVKEMAFSYWIPSLSNPHLSFLHDF